MEQRPVESDSGAERLVFVALTLHSYFNGVEALLSAMIQAAEGR